MPFKSFKLVILEFHHSRNRAKCYRTVMFAHLPDLIKINPNKIREMLCPETNKKNKQTNHETREQRHNCQKKELCLWIKKSNPIFFYIL